MRRNMFLLVGCLCVGSGLWTGPLRAQQPRAAARPLAANVIVPQSRSFATHPASAAVQITRVDVGVVIVEQAATTTMDIGLQNPGRSRIEAELLVPVPDGAVVRGFSFQGAASEPTAEVLPKDEARKTYEAIVAKVRDPALLEFAGYNLIRSSVFPLAPGGTQKIRLTYEHLLRADGDRIDYVLPRSESLDYHVPWNLSIRIQSKRPISTVYSPSHTLETTRRSPHVVSARVADNAAAQPGPLRLSYLLERNGVTASLLAYPDSSVGGGYFLLLAGLPAEPPHAADAPAIKREVTLVIDHSGSMSGQKLEQVREAALQILAGLEAGEAFNLLVYNDTVERFADAPVIKSEQTERAARTYLKRIRSTGGTNIYDALAEALRQKPAEDTLPIVLFLTDGLPTVGKTSEVAIRNVAIESNPHHRRIFTFGVGVDVNTPLLGRIANETRATATFVLPQEDVEVKVSQVFERLTGPLLADAKLEIAGSGKQPAQHRVSDILPSRLPDLFRGDQLVLLGQYRGLDPLTFKIRGNYLGKERTFRFTFGLDNATTKNAFVPRLWASRKIALLIDAIRQLGADAGLPGGNLAADDPKLKELVDEVVRLSTAFGILTEYTAFLADEGTNLARMDGVLEQARKNFTDRAIRSRTGLAAVNQEVNVQSQERQTALNISNRFYDRNMNRVSIADVQQINDRAFYKRADRWVDSRIVNRQTTMQPTKVIEFGSEEFRTLAHRLAQEGRQGSISLRGDILMLVEGEPVLVKAPTQ